MRIIQGITIASTLFAKDASLKLKSERETATKRPDRPGSTAAIEQALRSHHHSMRTTLLLNSHEFFAGLPMNHHLKHLISPIYTGSKRFLAKQNRWTVVTAGSIGLVGTVAAFALAPSEPQPPVEIDTVLEQLSTPIAILDTPENTVFLREERVERSDTLSSLMNRLGIEDPEADEFIRKTPSTQAISRQLSPGKAVTAKTNARGKLHSLYFPLNGKEATLVVERDGEGFKASEEVLHLDTRTVVKSGQIESSLFAATDAADIPDAIASQLAEVFGGDIDFYRDLRKGDRFSLVYQTFYNRGQVVRTGRILSAEFVNDRKVYSAFWYQSTDGKAGYFTGDGKNLRKAFLRSPLEFSRVTSGFSKARLHPVLQVSRAHKGIDYGAPTGTRVRAVADAVVEFAGRQGGYGNFIVLKHQGTYSTAYGHLNGFAPGIRKGARVGQGDTIGYVGSTGLATGPHLHYEFRVNVQQVNPTTIALPTSFPLDASQLARFKATTSSLRALLDLAKQTQMAAID